MNMPDLRVATFREQAAFEAYKEAIKNALDSANKAVEAIATASFSIATAYGALLGLVRPKDTAVAVPVVAPILAFAVAAAIALVARSLGVRVALADNTVESVAGDINGTITAKRILGWVALTFLFVALVAAGLLIVAAYAPPASEG
jgi:adenine deaminase